MQPEKGELSGAYTDARCEKPPSGLWFGAGDGQGRLGKPGLGIEWRNRGARGCKDRTILRARLP